MVSKYTIQLRNIVENGINLFDFDYPFYDNTKKMEFEKRFINHFYLREIGSETVGSFKHYLKIKFNEELPYYNELFRLATISYNELSNYSFKEEFTHETTTDNDFTGTGTNILEGGGTDEYERKYLDTPQGNVNAIDDGYLTNVTKDKTTNNTNSTGTSSSNSKGKSELKENYSKTLEGNKNISQAELLKQHIEVQKTLKSIEKVFFENCNDLFMLIY